MWTEGKEFRAWLAMLARCFDPKNDAWDSYGGRGITVCEEWKNSYPAFFNDMGNAPSPDYSLDRIDVNGNYCKENCRWATRETQCNNKRNNRMITHKGKTQTMSQWAREVGLSNVVLSDRLGRGWTVEEALETPLTVRPLMLTCDGRTQKVDDWAKEVGVCRKTIENRLWRGFSVEEAIMRPTPRLLTLNGRTQSRTEWAKELGISVVTIRNRLKAGATDEEALRSTRRKKNELTAESES